MEEPQKQKREALEKKNRGCSATKAEEWEQIGNTLRHFSQYTTLRIFQDHAIHVCDEDKA